MAQIVVISRKQVYLFCLFLTIVGCDWDVDTYEIHDVSQKHIFNLEVKGILSNHDASSIHVEGELDGTAQIFVLSPNADIHKQRDCSVADLEHIKAGKVNVIFNRSNHFKTGDKPYVYYLPCTAKKGYLKVRVSFNNYLKGDRNTQFL